MNNSNMQPIKGTLAWLKHIPDTAKTVLALSIGCVILVFCVTSAHQYYKTGMVYFSIAGSDYIFGANNQNNEGSNENILSLEKELKNEITLLKDDVRKLTKSTNKLNITVQKKLKKLVLQQDVDKLKKEISEIKQLNENNIVRPVWSDPDFKPIGNKQVTSSVQPAIERVGFGVLPKKTFLDKIKTGIRSNFCGDEMYIRSCTNTKKYECESKVELAASKCINEVDKTEGVPDPMPDRITGSFYYQKILNCIINNTDAFEGLNDEIYQSKYCQNNELYWHKKMVTANQDLFTSLFIFID